MIETGILNRSSFTYMVLILVLMILTSCQKPIEVDQIFYHGKIFTARTADEFVEAMAIKGGRIVGVGSSRDVRERYRAPEERQVDLQGRLVLPGFHDAHIHFWGGAKIQRELNLGGLRSLEAVLERVREAVRQARPGEWIIGRGWDHELWPQKRLPNRKMLDAISREHLIYLKRVDGHAAWVNTPVLRVLRYTRHTPDPPGGKIQRDRYGRPTGILFDKAFGLLDRLIPEPTYSEKKALIQQAIQKANRLGITAITDNSPEEIYRIYADLYQSEDLTLRVHFFFYYPASFDTLRRLLETVPPIPEFLTARLIKLFADGSLGSRSAYLLQPYQDDPGNTGLPRHPFGELLKRVRAADAAGFQVGVHAIGDAAVREVLDVFAALAEERPDRGRRWRIEHSQVVDSADFARYRQLGAIASMQPSHCITDLHWAEERLGARARFAYAWRTFLDRRVVLAFGTDWPVEPLNPMIGLYAGVTRRDTLGFPEGGWYPQERIRLGEAVRAYTYGSAYAAGAEGWSGTLQPGRVADFIVLDRDIFALPPDDILKARVQETYLGGKQVFPQK